MEQHCKTAPYPRHAPLHAFHSLALTEQPYDHRRKQGHRAQAYPQRAVGGIAVERLTHWITVEKTGELGPGNKQSERNQHGNDNAVGRTVAEVGTHHSRQLAALTARHIHTPPCLAKIGKHKVHGICPEYRHILGNDRHTRYACRTELYAPPQAAYHMGKHRDQHHGYDKTVVDTVAHYLLHSVEVYLMKQPHNQSR
ncbi:hypothetical protein IMSAG192_01417 [Muribaculaceae bacterium]|nr:hypothetical protein IMSAG192_01417 [Muribaculaceae bacterium]